MASIIGKRVLMVLAHCDDELVCGWPILQNPAVNKSLIIISSDRNNSTRQWCSHRKFVTQDLSKLLGINVCILDYDSDFYKLNHRNGGLARLEHNILKAVANYSFDYLFTHNPYGEYGHLDHIFLSNLMVRSIDTQLMISDITLRSDWTQVEPQSARYAEMFYRNLLETVDLDRSFYRKVMRFYETRGAWTWFQDPSDQARLFLI